jgi:acetoin utilization deacetylase AcuC-like enzyme
VAILDCDAHYGNGTVSLVTSSDRIAIFDISGGAWSDSPTAEQDEFYEVANRTEYHAALNRLPAFLDRVRPALALYQAGVDPFEEDPVGGISGVTAEFLRFRDQFVIGHIVHRRVPLVINLAGGYLEDGTAERLHVETIRVAADTVRRHRTRELCSFDPETGELTDEAFHAELLGDDTTEADLDLTPCANMTDEEIDRYLDEHAKKHYGTAKPEADGK